MKGTKRRMGGQKRKNRKTNKGGVRMKTDIKEAIEHIKRLAELREDQVEELAEVDWEEVEDMDVPEYYIQTIETGDMKIVIDIEREDDPCDLIRVIFDIHEITKEVEGIYIIGVVSELDLYRIFLVMDDLQDNLVRRLVDEVLDTFVGPTL